jgi:hypothetical protein
LGLSRGVRELDGELEDTLRALRKVVGLTLGFVCCGDGSIFYVSVGGRVLAVVRGLVGFGISSACCSSTSMAYIALTLSVIAVRQCHAPMTTYI